MKPFYAFFALLILAAASTFAAETKALGPEAIVADLYKQDKADASPFFQTKNRALVERYFVKDLAGLIWKDAVDAKGELGAIDFQPLYGAQDPQITGFKLGAGTVNEDKASVTASFRNQGETQTVTFALVQDTDRAWKISDITYPDKSTLRKVLTFKY